ncbi:MAG: PRC-barrel domain-containing protein [Dehalococcoidia bacterium]
MAMDPVHDIRPGLEVHSEDGERLGTIKEVTPAAIKVDAPMRPDFWLPRDHVLSYTNERVTMDFAHADLYRYENAGDEH